ncbi:MAG: universal stress protein [Anaerolineaceae bacterium]|nr:universal stress protein [Anaerolineaceae bacterium]
MFENILLAYDGSDQAREAANLAGNLARSQKFAPVLWIVTVVDRSPRELGEPYLSQYIEKRTSSGQSLVRDAVGLVGPGIEIHTEILFGSPAESILEVAETRDCDLIIMGTRGLSLLEGLLLGSQTQKVINHANCPVLVVK